MITVFYDGKCSNCSKEINHYKRIASPKDFQWINVTSDPQSLENELFTQSEALLYLHAKDQNHTLHVGIDAFILIWKHLPYWKFLATFASLPVIKGLLKILYTRFAQWRFNRLDHCQLALKNDRKKVEK